jgi:hypothetical protein
MTPAFMTPEAVFSVANGFAGLAWLLLIFGGRTRWTASLVCGLIAPLLLAALYTTLIITNFGGSPQDFTTLDGVAKLFSNRWILVAGWVHYLTFDLFVGSWELRDARERNIPHWVAAPCLLMTFLFGPIGLLLWFIVRFAATRTAAMQPDKGLGL